MSLLRYVLSEVSRGYLPEADEQLYTEKLRRVSTFMKTPRELEKVGAGLTPTSLVRGRSLALARGWPVDTGLD